MKILYQDGTIEFGGIGGKSMVELETEVCLATIQLYLEKPVQQRSEKLKALAKESMKILATKQAQFRPQDKALYERFLEEKL